MPQWLALSPNFNPLAPVSHRVVYFNGSFVRESDARLSIYDSALVMGDMAYEVTRTCHHRPLKLREHVDRLYRTLEVLRIDPGLSRDELVAVSEETLARNLPAAADDVDWNIIHNVSRGPAAAFADAFLPEERRPTVLVSCFPLDGKMAGLAAAYTDGVDLIVPRQKSLPQELLDPSIKTRSRLHYQLANQQATAHNPAAWAVLLDPDGNLTEGTSGNVFLVSQGVLHTPQSRNVLPGITRTMVLEQAGRLGISAAESNLTPADARTADEMFLTSTSIGVIHARSFAGKPLGDGAAGPLTAKLRQALHDEIGLDFGAQAQMYATRRGA